MKFARTYSAPGDPYAGIEFEPRTSRIVNPDGKVVFEAKDVAIPPADPAALAEAISKLIEAAGGKMVSMYSTVAEGPGALVIFDVPDPASAPAISGVAVAGGGVHNVRLMRLLSQDEVIAVRQTAAKIRGAYKKPGQ